MLKHGCWWTDIWVGMQVMKHLIGNYLSTPKTQSCACALVSVCVYLRLPIKSKKGHKNYLVAAEAFLLFPPLGSTLYCPTCTKVQVWRLLYLALSER